MEKECSAGEEHPMESSNSKSPDTNDDANKKRLQELVFSSPDKLKAKNIIICKEDLISNSTANLLFEPGEMSSKTLHTLELEEKIFSIKNSLTSDESKSLTLCKSMHGKTEVHIAAEKGDLTRLGRLDRGGSELNGRDDEGWTPAMYATSAGKLEALQLLQDAGADLQVRDKNGRTLLHLAANYDRLDLLRWLLEIGFDINAQDFFNMTALHLGAIAGHVETVHFLIERGADTNVQDDNHRTPLKVAQLAGQSKVIDLLVKDVPE